MRKPIIVANWKMHKNMQETRAYIDRLSESMDKRQKKIESILCVPYTNLIVLYEQRDTLPTGYGAQNMCSHLEGAVTGEISALMLNELAVEYVIIGHSERRKIFKESDTMMIRKMRVAHDVGITPILCVGENDEQYIAGKTTVIVTDQVESALSDLSPDEVATSVIAYEPIWAIGTSNAATPEVANAVIGIIRQHITQMYGNKTAERVRILYGGSVDADNIAEFLAEPEIDGALVGGASLNPDNFMQMIDTVDSLDKYN